MKKSVIYIFGISIVALTLINCGSSKKGCGLTSDSEKIEQTFDTQTTLVSETK